jgi:hypothetical protein
MQFEYKINLEIVVRFEAPLLGADTTIFGREKANVIAKESLEKLIKNYSRSESFITQSIVQDRLKGKIKGNIKLQTARGPIGT